MACRATKIAKWLSGDGFTVRAGRDAYARVAADRECAYVRSKPQGRASITATGLCHFGAREYDASITRWLSRDPALLDGEDENAFVYAKNDPINRVDRAGLSDGTAISTVVAKEIEAVLVTLA